MQNTETQNEQTPPGPQNREQTLESAPPEERENEKRDAEQEPPKDEPGAKKRFALILGIGAVILVVLLLVGLIPRLRARPALEKTAKENSSSIPEVDVIHAQRGPMMTTLQLPGNIEALQDTDITARASGYVSKWLVDIGDQVQAGQVLAVIDTPEVDQQVREAEANVAQSQAALVQQRAEVSRAIANLAQSRQNAQRQKSQLVQAQADLNLAKVTADRWLYLVKEGAASQQSADEKVAALSNNRANVAALQSAVQASQSDIAAFQAALRSSEANVGAAQAGVRASQANVKRIQALRGFREVRAPFSGVVTARSVDAGSLIGGGSSDAGSGGSGGAASGGSASGGGSPSAPTGGQGANSARNGMYNSTPDTGIASGGGAASGGAGGNAASGGSGVGAYGDSQAAAGGAGGSAGTGGTTGATAGGGGSSTGGSGQQGSGGGAAISQSSGAGGAAISPGVSLYRVARLDVLRIQVSVPQSFAPSIQIGNIAKLTVREYAGREFIGKVTRTARSLDPQTRTMLTEIQLSNRDKRLLPGAYAQVEFSVARTTPPLVIPAGALIENGKGTQVAVVGQDNKIHLVPVTVGRDYGQQVEITQGLKPEDWLVVDPSDSTQEGAAVQPITPEEKKRRAEEARQKQEQEKVSKGEGGDAKSEDKSGEDKGGKSEGGGAPQGGADKGGQDKGGAGGASKGGPPPNLGQSYGGGLSDNGQGKSGAAQGNQSGGPNGQSGK